MHKVEIAILAAREEGRCHEYAIGELSRGAWKAFQHLRCYELDNARAAISAALKAARSPGSLMDIRDATDKLVAEALSVDPDFDLTDLIDLLARRRRALDAEYGRVRETCREVLAMYRRLRNEAKDLLYGRLTEEWEPQA